jgi:sterol desaturase/sphingolipid hydroxylase (fatty acid hydroxylase superfamily)
MGYVQTVRWLLSNIWGFGFQLQLSLFLALGLLEQFRPVVPVPLRHYAFNVGYAFVNNFFVAAIAPLTALGVASAIRHVTTGVIDLRSGSFNGILGAVIAMLIWALIFDFFNYWLHRLEHRSSILWQEHLLHHCDEYVNVTSAARSHFLEQILMPLFITVPMAILFALPPITISAIALTPVAWNHVVHLNLRVGFGRLWWLLTSPQYHRVHHSLEPAHFDKNFAAWFPLWDILFGTAYRPEDGEYPSTGVGGVVVRSMSQAVLLPFVRWAAMAKSV